MNRKALTAGIAVTVLVITGGLIHAKYARWRDEILKSAVLHLVSTSQTDPAYRSANEIVVWCPSRFGRDPSARLLTMLKLHDSRFREFSSTRLPDLIAQNPAWQTQGQFLIEVHLSEVQDIDNATVSIIGYPSGWGGTFYRFQMTRSGSAWSVTNSMTVGAG